MKNFQEKSHLTLERMALRITRSIGSTNSILIHTAFFIVSFTLFFWGVAIDKILLVVTTLVSLEAIYLSIFIQMSMNRQARRLREVARDVEEIQEDVEGIEKDVDEIQKDVDEIQEDVEDIQEEEEQSDVKDDVTLHQIEHTLQILISEISELKKHHEHKSK